MLVRLLLVLDYPFVKSRNEYVDNSLTNNRSSGNFENPQDADEESGKKMLCFRQLWSVLIGITFERTSQVRKPNKEFVRYNAQHTRQSVVLDICHPNLPNERSQKGRLSSMA